MTKYILILFLFLFTGFSVVGQNLRSYVIGTYGASAMHDDGALYISIGEPMNTEIEEDGNTVAQGFLQVTILGKTVATTETIDFDLKVFPNPVNQYLKIELSDIPDKSAQYLIHDQMGRLVSSAAVTDMMTQVDFRTLSTGVYYLQLISPDKQSKIVKILKQNL